MFLQEGQLVWLSGDPIIFNSFVLPNVGTHDCVFLFDSRTIGIIWQAFFCTSSTIGNFKIRPICKQEQTTSSESLDIGN